MRTRYLRKAEKGTENPRDDDHHSNTSRRLGSAHGIQNSTTAVQTDDHSNVRGQIQSKYLHVFHDLTHGVSRPPLYRGRPDSFHQYTKESHDKIRGGQLQFQLVDRRPSFHAEHLNHCGNVANKRNHKHRCQYYRFHHNHFVEGRCVHLGFVAVQEQFHRHVATFVFAR